MLAITSQIIKKVCITMSFKESRQLDLESLIMTISF